MASSSSRGLRSPKALLLLAWWLGLYQPPDRAALAAIWRALARDEPGFRVLFVGVRAYTRALTRSLRRGTVVTIDADPLMRFFGARRHHVARLQDLEENDFDLALVNGVLGWGIDTIAEADRALRRTVVALRSGGLLVLGVNEARQTTPDVDAIGALALLEPACPPPFGVNRYEVPSPFEGSHTFRFFRKA